MISTVLFPRSPGNHLYLMFPGIYGPENLLWFEKKKMKMKSLESRRLEITDEGRDRFVETFLKS